MSEDISLVETLSHIQVYLSAKKGLRNDFGNYKYRSFESILEALKPFLKDNDCALISSDEIVEIAGRVYVKATVTLLNKKEKMIATAYAREQSVKKGMDEAQITGSASSYARKYAACGLFAIDDGQDPDTHDNRKQGESPVLEEGKDDPAPW